MRLLARREHTRAELERKLAVNQSDLSADDRKGLLDSLEASGLLSDARFAEARARVRGGLLGNRRLAQELERNGVDESLIQAAMATLPDELERARSVWRRRFGSRPNDRTDWTRQARFLLSRGFSVGTIRRLLDSPDEEGP